MPSIGLIDDSVEWAELGIPAMYRVLKKNGYADWSVETTPPFIEKEKCLSWINEHEVRALLVDERLRESFAAGGKGHVDYFGHELVEFLRLHLKELPIYIISSYGLDGEPLQRRFKDVEDFIIRDKFQEKMEEYTLRFARAGQHFVKTFESDLATLSKTTSKMVLGDATAEEVERVEAIRQNLSLSLPSGISDRSEEQASLGRFLARLDTLRHQIESLTRKKDLRKKGKAKGKLKGKK